MKMSIRIPLGFAATLCLVLAGGVFGIYQLNGVVAQFENRVLQHVAGGKKAPW